MSDHDAVREAVSAAQAWLDDAALAGGPCDLEYRVIARLARAAASTIPKAMATEVWHLEYSVWNDQGWEPRIQICGDQVIAEARALAIRSVNGMTITRITGPHKHLVPA